jgi:gliding motility-associated-like protein
MRIKNYLLKSIFSALLLLAFGNAKVHAQLQIDSTLTPAQLVQTVLLGGGVTVSNITYTGFPNSISKFTATGTNLGLASGVMLTTGYAAVAYGPNTLSNAGNDVGPPSFPSPASDSDPLLDAIVQIQSPGVYTNDAAVLEFDFVPTSDTVKFRYVFGSEEYPEFVGSINDVFAFFLTGPGGYNNSNIALIPGTTTPITIGNVNDIDNSQYYVDNSVGTSIQYDGFTTVMTAVAAVQCGQTYHIKLAIADASDGVWDSAVFLEAGSFSSSGSVLIIPDVTYSTNDTVMYEGCGDATIKIVRTGSNIQAQTYNYILSGTATNGVDCNNLSGQVTIPAGQDTAYITLNPVADGIPEGQETMTITVTNTVCNNNSTTSVTIYFNDVTPITVDAGIDQSTACTGGGNITLTATPANGVPTYTYSWAPTGDLTQSISVLPAVTTVYTVTVTDICGNQATDNVSVAVEPPMALTMTASNDTTICQNASATLTATPQGGNGGITVLWNTGDQSNTIQVSPMVTSVYSVTVTDACNQTVSDNITVTVVPVDANFDYLFVSNNSVNFSNNSVGYENGVWWDFGDGQTSTEFEPTHTYASSGTFIVTLAIVNSAGCPDTIQYSLIVKPDFYFYIPNSFTPNSDGINESYNGKGQGFEEYTMSIYNRWGQRIFNTTSLNNGWDGKDANGNLVPIDTYVYVVGLRITADEDEIVYRGKVAVIR